MAGNQFSGYARSKSEPEARRDTLDRNRRFTEAQVDDEPESSPTPTLEETRAGFMLLDW